MNDTENSFPHIEEQIAKNGFFASTTVGTSMRPMLRNRRDRIILLPVGKERLKKYDLPLYHRPDGKYILHRIIGVRDGHYVIRGDNTYAKEYVPDAWIVGYVSEFYRGNRHILTTSKSYRFYAKFWNFIYPVRYLYHAFRSFASHVWHKIKPKKQAEQ